jgi:hypothetical protein
MGFGVREASDAIEKAKVASTADEKIKHLTEAIEVLIAHLDHLESEKRMDEMNRQLGNV